MADDFEYSDLLNKNLIQKIQDDFAQISGVGSVIYDLDGKPITRPSNFCEYCRLIRGTGKGLENCIRSDAELWELSKKNRGGALLCKSGKLMDGIAPIIVEGKRIADWGIGQVLFEKIDEEWVRSYAEEIGIDEDVLVDASRKIKIIPEESFHKTIQYLITFSRELSELALANVRLKNEITSRIKSEERYSAIVKNAIVGICEITNRGILEYVNDQLYDMLGYRKDALIGYNINAIFSSDRDFESYFKGIVDYANRSFANIGYDFNGYLKKKNGDPLPCRICLTPQKNLSNQIMKSSAVIIDTSAELSALQTLENRNRELFESKKQLDLFFDSNMNALCIYNNGYKRIKYNPAYVKFLNDIGKSSVLHHDNLWEPLDKNSLTSILSGDTREYSVKKEYGVKLYTIKASPLPDYDNTISRFLVTIEDTTDYHMMMENALFAEKMSGVGMLASGIAHDLKGIFAILGNSNTSMKKLIADGKLEQERERFHKVLGMQEEGLIHGRKLLSQLISFSGKRNEYRENFILKECVDNIVRIYNGKILEKNADVKISIREDILLNCQQSRFIQIIINLFSNALEAIANNGIIYIFENCSPGNLNLTISDDGPGIEAAEQEEIFRAFYTTKNEGTGLGLFSVKNILDELGGTVQVDSLDGSGACFTIDIADNSNMSVKVM